MRALGLFNPLMRELAEMTYEFDEPFVLDTAKYQSTFGTAGTPLATAIASTVHSYRSLTGTPNPPQEGPTPWLVSTPTPASSQMPLAASAARTPAQGSDPSPTPPPASGSSSRPSPQDGDQDIVRFNWRSMPGGAITEHTAFAGLAAEGKTTPRGAPKNPLQLGATLWHFRHESRVTSPATWVQNLILPPLWALAKVFGVRPYYARWDSRSTPRLEPTT